MLGSAGYFCRVLLQGTFAGYFCRVLTHGTYARYLGTVLLQGTYARYLGTVLSQSIRGFFGVGVEQCRFLVRSVYLGGQYSAQ